MVIYKQLITYVKDFLRDFNFRKKGENFILEKGNNLGIINFQKSRRSSQTDILFTINVGVYLNSLSMFDYINMLKTPVIDGCHWKDRINPIASSKKESWWAIKNDTSLDEIYSKVRLALECSALPQIEKFIVDANLEKAWLSGISGGLSEQQRQLYTIVLLKKNGNENWLYMVEQLRNYSRGKSFETNIAENIVKILSTNE